MKAEKVVLTLLLALFAFPFAAIADNTFSWTNTAGSLNATASSLSVTSTITAVQFPNGSMLTGSLGMLNLSTGALVGGSLGTGCLGPAGCAFDFAGSTFSIVGAGGGPSLTGMFTGDVTLVGSVTSAGKYTYTLSGVLSGTTNGTEGTGGTTQLTITLNQKFTGGMVALAGGATNIMPVPEPGTLGLLGTGAFGLAGVLRRRRVV